MKHLKLKPLNLLYNMVVVLLIAGMIFGYSSGVLIASAAIAVASGTVLSFVPKVTAAFMAVQKEIWQNHIEEEIFKNNQFLNFCYDAGQNMIANKVVHIPQSGGSGNVVKNRTVVPATVRKRNDTDVIYLIDEYTTDPVLIPHADTKELSYNKRASVLSEDTDKLNETIAEEMIWNWMNSTGYQSYVASSMPTNQILATTGTAEVPASAEGATGNRFAASINDLQRLRQYFKSINRWFEGRMFALLSPDMEAQMFPADSLTTATYMNNVTEQERREGIMYKAQGWNLLSRSTVARVDAAGDPKAPGEVGATDDDTASLFWYHDAVEKAFGGVEMFDKPGDPQFYGDLYSFLARMGGRARRTDYLGIGLLKQAKVV